MRDFLVLFAVGAVFVHVFPGVFVGALYVLAVVAAIAVVLLVVAAPFYVLCRVDFLGKCDRFFQRIGL